MVLLLTACVRETNWPIPDEPVDLVVVDGMVTDERKMHVISLTRPVNSLNAIPQPISGAALLVSDEDSAWTFSENPSGSGQYVSTLAFLGTAGKNYNLLIYSGDKVFSAGAALVPGRAFAQLRYAKNSGNDLYHIDWVASAFDAEDPAMWEVLLDWTGVPGFENIDPDLCKARLFFYTLPTLDVSEIFAPAVEKVSFPAGTVVTQRRYSVAPDHAEFLRELMLETNWQGGFFNTAPANVHTNLSPGATGYFSASAVTVLSFIITP
jgi:hypothetical protein